MESKIRIKLGPIEVEYEGSEAFLTQELPDLIKTISELYRASNIPIKEEDGESKGGGRGKVQLSTGSIAAKLSCASGPELLLAAAAHLTLARGTETFTRQQLLTEIRTAKAYYKKSYNANLTTLLNGLVKGGKFNEASTGTYSLSADARKEMEGRLVART